MKRPLADIRVCDVTQNLAGPFCCQILGDLGAEVVKVEPPGGDPARAWGPPFWGADGTLFLSVNRNKRSVVLDIRTEEGREALHRIAATCDVFVQASRAGVAERRGYDDSAIRAVRQDVIHVSITAYGDRGPLREAPGYDPLMQAFSGIMSVTGHEGSPPTRVGGSVIDYGTGMWAAIAVMGALRTRDLTGEGAKVDTSLLDTSLGWISYHLMGYLATGRVPGRMGTGLESIAPYQAFRTRDRYVMIAAGNDAIFRRLCHALEIPELASDPRFATNPSRVEHREALVPSIERRTAALSSADLLERLHAHSVPASPIQDIAEVTRDPQVLASEMLAPRDHPHIPEYQDLAIPLRVDGERPSFGSAPPRPGQHTREVLDEAGYTAAKIDELIARGIAEHSQ